MHCICKHAPGYAPGGSVDSDMHKRVRQHACRQSADRRHASGARVGGPEDRVLVRVRVMSSHSSAGGWSSVSESAEDAVAATDGSAEEEEEPPMLPGVARALSSSTTGPTCFAEEEETATVIAEVLQLRRDVQEMEALACREASELEWLHRVATDTRASLNSMPRSIAPRSQHHAGEKQKARTLCRGPSTDWANASPRYLDTTVSFRAQSPLRSLRKATRSIQEQADSRVLTGAPRSTRAVVLRQQHRIRTAAARSREDTLKEAGIRARRAYLKVPAGLNIIPPSARSQVVDRIFEAMDKRNLQTTDLVIELGLPVSAKDLKVAFRQHDIQLSSADIHALVKEIGMDGNVGIDAQVFIERMRKLRSAHRKLPREVEMAVHRIQAAARGRIARNLIGPRLITRNLAAQRIQAAARGRIARKPPSLPSESDSEDAMNSDECVET